MLHIGVGAHCSILLSYLHTSQVMKVFWKQIILTVFSLSSMTLLLIKDACTHPPFSPIPISLASSQQHIDMFVSTKKVVHQISIGHIFLTIITLHLLTWLQKRVTLITTMTISTSPSFKLPIMLRIMPSSGINVLKSTMTMHVFVKISLSMAPQLMLKFVIFLIHKHENGSDKVKFVEWGMQ